MAELRALPDTKGDRAAAKKLHGRALKHHNKKEYKQAAELWHRAAKADPGWWAPFYNMACAAALGGQEDRVVPLLELALRRNSSPRLHRFIRKDRDLDPVRGTAAFKKLLAGIKGTSGFARFFGKQLDCVNGSGQMDYHVVLKPAGKFTGGASWGGAISSGDCSPMGWTENENGMRVRFHCKVKQVGGFGEDGKSMVGEIKPEREEVLTFKNPAALVKFFTSCEIENTKF